MHATAESKRVGLIALCLMAAPLWLAPLEVSAAPAAAPAPAAPADRERARCAAQIHRLRQELAVNLAAQAKAATNDQLQSLQATETAIRSELDRCTALLQQSR